MDLWCLISGLHLTAVIKYLAAAVWWKHHIIKTESAELQQRASCCFAKSTLLLRHISRAKATSRQTLPITCRSAQLLADTLTHIYTQVYLFQAFQPVSTELHNQRAVLFPQRSRIVCTHMMSCITVINHVEEITISTRQLQRAVARSNWILLIFPLLPLLPPESRLLLRQTNLEGWGNAIRRERRGENTLVWVLILNQTLMIIQSKLVPLFTVSNYCLYCQVVTKARVDLWTVQDVAAFCRKNKNLRLPLHCWPACQLQSMANIWGWVGGWGGSECTFFFSVFFCLRVTACSLYIHKTIIFTLFSLYLEVNGCQETNEAARNSCTSTRRLPCDAEGGIKQQTSALLTGRGEKCFCFDKPTQTNRHALELAVTSTAHNPRLIFTFSPVSLRQLVSHVSH